MRQQRLRRLGRLGFAPFQLAQLARDLVGSERRKQIELRTS
jgi:hypothetical protein